MKRSKYLSTKLEEKEKSRRKCPRHLSCTSKGLTGSGAVRMKTDTQIEAILENRKDNLLNKVKKSYNSYPMVNKAHPMYL